MAIAAIMNQVSAVRTGVLRLLAQGCTAEQINPYTTAYTRVKGVVADPSNPDSPPDGHCDLYSQNGAGVIPVITPAEAHDAASLTSGTQQAGHSVIRLLSVQDVGTSAKDMVFRLEGVKRSTCLAMLKNFNIPLSEIPIEVFTTPLTMSAANAGSMVGSPVGDDVPELAGRYDFPISTAAVGTGVCAFYSVILAR